MVRKFTLAWGATSSDFGKGDKQWFGAHGPDYQPLYQTLMGATSGF